MSFVIVLLFIYYKIIGLWKYVIYKVINFFLPKMIQNTLEQLDLYCMHLYIMYNFIQCISSNLFNLIPYNITL